MDRAQRATPDRTGRHGDWANPHYDETRMVSNNRGTGLLGPYQPVVGYMPKHAFEALGSFVSWRAVPTWAD